MQKNKMFRYKGSIPEISYVRQGYIYFRSRLYSEMTAAERQTVNRLCLEAVRAAGITAGVDDYAMALLKFVTTDRRAEQLERECNVSRSCLYRCVREYYLRFPRKL